MHTPLKHHFLIVPAMTDQAGQCRIVHRVTPAHVSVGLNDYRDKPALWMEVGIMASDGHVVCLDAWPEVWKDMRDSEPLMASTTFSYKTTEDDLVTAFFSRLQQSPRTEKDIEQCSAHLRMFCPNHFASSEQAGEWLKRITPGTQRQVDSDFSGVFNDVVQGLREYHEMLRSPEVVQLVKELMAMDYLSTGNNQADYERLRDAMERLVSGLEEEISAPQP